MLQLTNFVVPVLASAPQSQTMHLGAPGYSEKPGYLKRKGIFSSKKKDQNVMQPQDTQACKPTNINTLL